MNFLERLQRRAAALKKHVVLPEGDDPRVVKAARELVDRGICQVTLIGEPTTVGAAANEANVSLDGIQRLSPREDPDFSSLAASYHQLRQAKGVSRQTAEQELRDPVFYAAMLVREGYMDAVVAGAAHATAHVLRAGLRTIGVREGFSVVSSCFLMISPDHEHILGYGDCGVIPRPTPHQLADIALSTADTFQLLAERPPKVAFLSFSTKGSAEHEEIERVREAVKLTMKRAPHLPVDGELQADAALVPSVGRKKAPNSPVAGHANILIFPDLNAGNIAYKITERLAGFTALGPLLQGMAKPMHDLSRGCKAEDIVNVAAIACIQADSF